MNSSQVNLTMFNPLDGVNFLTGTALFATVGVITGSNTLLVLAAPLITGIFMVLCKVLELYVRARNDKRAAQMRTRLAELENKVRAGYVTREQVEADFAERGITNGK